MLATPIVLILYCVLLMVFSEVMLRNTCYSVPRSPDSRKDSQNVLCSETLILITFSKFFLSYKREAQNRLKKGNVMHKYRVNIMC